MDAIEQTGFLERGSMIYKLKQVYYLVHFAEIGGIESHLYYLAKKYGDRDWTCVVKSGSPAQIARMRKYVRVIVLKQGDEVECEECFMTYDLSVLNRIHAKKYYLVLHNDYQKLVDLGRLNPKEMEINPIFTKYLAVSEAVKRGFNPDADVDVVYFPVELDEFEDPVFLMSATRLTTEKGGWRYKKLAEEMDRAGVNYLWQIYTNQPMTIDSPNVQFMPPRLDIVSKFPLYDACVQLSDVEGYSVTIQEALKCGLPMVATPLPMCTIDLKLNDTNCIYIPFDMKDIGEQIENIRHIRELKRNMPKVKFPKEKWDKYITKEKRGEPKKITIKAVSDYYDVELEKTINKGETYEVNEDRGIYIIQNGFAVKGG